MIIAIPEPFKTLVTFSHPVLMFFTLLLAFYAGYLGLQYRKIRSVEGEEKKVLISKRFNVQHYQLGSVFLVLMVAGAIGGMAITYNNNGKLFVGSHLIAGLGLVVLAALSASLAPLLQQAKDWARSTHIALNTLIVGVFVWQAVTGWEIVQKILVQMAKPA